MTTKQKTNITIFARARNQTRDLWHHSLMRYIWTTETAEPMSSYLSVPRNGSKFVTVYKDIMIQT